MEVRSVQVAGNWDITPELVKVWVGWAGKPFEQGSWWLTGSRTAILNGCWCWKEYECYHGHEEMLGRGGLVQCIPGQGSWVVRIFGMGMQKKGWSWKVELSKEWVFGSKVVGGKKGGLGSWGMEKSMPAKFLGRSGFEGSMEALGQEI